jgi:2-polyprenyl-6-hydroxyphenyl methylase/3-demethylubiquinone-9 3-methyltransferase
MIPARLDYLEHVFCGLHKKDLKGAVVLDVGCGGGLFAEEVARLGCDVCGIDPSPGSIKAAVRHAKETGLAIDYRVAPGEALPFEDSTFDLVYCCDVLEHVEDVGAVISESARVLKANGIFLYDTINRTGLSRLLMIKIVQDWFRLAPPDLHDWRAFIKPRELYAVMRRFGLKPQDTVGLIPRLDPVANTRRLFEIRKLKRGEMTYAQFGRSIMFNRSRIKLMNYMGYAVKVSVKGAAKGGSGR